MTEESQALCALINNAPTNEQDILSIFEQTLRDRMRQYAAGRVACKSIGENAEGPLWGRLRKFGFHHGSAVFEATSDFRVGSIRRIRRRRALSYEPPLDRVRPYFREFGRTALKTVALKGALDYSVEHY